MHTENSNDLIKDSRIMEDLLNALGISANYLSKKVGVSHGAIFHIKNGVNYLSNEMIDKIIKVYPNVNYQFLKHKELPVLLSEREIQTQMEMLNLPSNQSVSFTSISKFIGMPDKVEGFEVTLDRIEEKLDIILANMGLSFDEPDKIRS